MRDAERASLLRLAEEVADRRAVDWEARLRDSDAALAHPIRMLRLVQDIESFHRSLAASARDVDPMRTASIVDAPQDALSGSDVGSTWGPLRLRESLGKGAAGDVFRAYDADLDTDVALKLFRGARNHLDEARKLARVRHPNVLTVHGVAVHDGRAGLWTELLEGQTLESALHANGPFSAQETALIGIDLCRAIAAVHRAGLVHRDVKAGNVMRASGGRIVLLDFSVGSERDAPIQSAMVGTPLYMAPELFRGEDSGTATDIYSLGVTLYRLVSGHYPVEAETAPELMELHRRGRSTPLLDVRPDLPSPFAEVVERALSPDPGRRYSSAGEMERALAAFVGAAPLPTPSPGPAFWRRAAAAVAGVALVVALGFGWRWLSRPFAVEAEWLQVREEGVARLDPGARISPGDCVALKLRGSRPMHVYVVNEDASGNASRLFPPAGGPAATLAARAEHRLPAFVEGQRECWRVGPGGGEERMLVVASASPLPRLEALIADLPEPPELAPRRRRGVTGRVPYPRPEDGSRVLAIVEALGEEGETEPWIWQVRFENVAIGSP